MAEPFEVLLASDFTARSDRPLDRALQFAAEKNGRLAIVHVLEGVDRPGVVDNTTAGRLRADLPSQAADAELVIRTGSAPKVLAQTASKRGSDLIVTGVARYNAIGDYLLGTAVDHIIRNAEVPVLIVRARPKGPYRQVLVATDYSDCSRVALLTAARLLPDALITLVHAFHVPFEGWLKGDDVKEYVRKEAQDGLDAFLAHPDILPDLRMRIEALVEEGDTGSVVVRKLAETAADLLVLGTHGRSGFAYATIGSQAEAMLACVNTDVLMVRERKA